MLLDVDVLLALAWPNHQHHASARQWFLDRQSQEWCTCAITQLGFIRISSHPAYSEHARSPAEAAALLQACTGRPGHRFLGADLAPTGLEWDKVQGPRQTTDVYLARLAQHHGMRLLTFDRRIGRIPGLRGSVELLDG